MVRKSSLSSLTIPEKRPGAVASRSKAFGVSLAAHLSSLSEGLPRAQEDFSAALAGLANTRPEDVRENQVYEVFSKGTVLVPIELDHVRRVLSTMSDGETLTNMVIAHAVCSIPGPFGPLAPDPACPNGPSHRKL